MPPSWDTVVIGEEIYSHLHYTLHSAPVREQSIVGYDKEHGGRPIVDLGFDPYVGHAWDVRRAGELIVLVEVVGLGGGWAAGHIYEPQPGFSGNWFAGKTKDLANILADEADKLIARQNKGDRT